MGKWGVAGWSPLASFRFPIPTPYSRLPLLRCPAAPQKALPMTYAFTPVPLPTLPIKGSDQLFPIHRIYCVGRNYAEHTKEMGGDTKDPPFFFQKNPDNIIADGTFPYPPQTQNVHFE